MLQALTQFGFFCEGIDSFVCGNFLGFLVLRQIVFGLMVAFSVMLVVSIIPTISAKIPKAAIMAVAIVHLLSVIAAIIVEVMLETGLAGDSSLAYLLRPETYFTDPIFRTISIQVILSVLQIPLAVDKDRKLVWTLLSVTVFILGLFMYGQIGAFI